jgi:hypothetical protein
VQWLKDFAPIKGDPQGPQAFVKESMEDRAFHGQGTDCQLDFAAVRGCQVQSIESLAGSSDRIPHPITLESAQCVREEDITTSLDLRQRQTLEQRDRIALFGQMTGGGTTGRTGADDDDIAVAHRHP